MQVKKQQSELDMKQCTGYIMQNAGLDEAQARIKIARKNINNLRHADDTTLMAESEEELAPSLGRYAGGGPLLIIGCLSSIQRVGVTDIHHPISQHQSIIGGALKIIRSLFKAIT